MVIIREYMASDLDGVSSLMTDLGYPTSSDEMTKRLKRIESNPNYKTFVAIIDNRVVGMVGFHTIVNYESDELVTHILALVVSDLYQGQGIGKKLMQFVEEWSLSNGSKMLYLTSGIKVEREKAHEFYKQMGFEITGYRFIKILNDFR